MPPFCAIYYLLYHKNKKFLQDFERLFRMNVQKGSAGAALRRTGTKPKGGGRLLTTWNSARWCRNHQSLVYTVCHQLVPDAGDAQDLTQETFLAAWRAIDRCPSGFEKTVAGTHRCQQGKDYLRSAWVRRVNIPGDDVLALEGAPPGTQPEQQVLDALGEEELTVMILDLREPTERLCRLVLLEQHTMAEAAQLCGRPPKTVEAQIYRAKRCWHSRYYSVKTMERSAYMELFDKNGCLTDEGLQALQAGGLDELGRLEPPSIYPTAINAWTATPLC